MIITKEQMEAAVKNNYNILAQTMGANSLFGNTTNLPPAEVVAFSTAWLYSAFNIKALHVSKMPYVTTIEGRERSREIEYTKNFPKLIYQTKLSLDIYGYAYWFREKRRSGKQTYRWLDPLAVTPVIENNRGLTAFRYNSQTFQVDPITKLSKEIVYFWLPSLREYEPGVPPAKILERSGGTLYFSAMMLSLFFQQGGMPLTAIEVPPGVDREQSKALESRFQRMVSGVKNAWKVIALNRELKVHQLSFKPSEMDLSPIRQEMITEVCVATGVPQFILTGENTGGLGSDSTAHQARLLFTQTCLNEADFIFDVINTQIMNLDGYEIKAEPNKLEIIQEAQLLQVQAVNAAVGQPVMTVDEGREWLGLPPLPKQQQEELKPEPPPTPQAEENTTQDDPAEAERKTLRNWIAKRIKKSKPLNGFVPAMLKKSEVFNTIYYHTVKQLQNMEHLDNPKAVDILEQFQVELLALSALLQNGTMSLNEYEDRFKRLIDLTLKRLFSLGAGDDYDNLPQPAQNTIDDMSQEQQDYSGAIALALASGEYEDNPAGLSNRVGLWVSILGGALFLGRMWGDDNKRLEWRLGGTVEHCTTCSTLNGQVKTAKEWRESGYQPQGSMLECKGFHCQCGLYEV